MNNPVRLSINGIERLLRCPSKFDKVFVQDLARDSDEFKKVPFDGDYFPINEALDHCGRCTTRGGLHVAYSEGFFQVFATIHRTCHPNVPFANHSARIKLFCDELDRIPRGAIVNQIEGLDGDQFTTIVKEGKGLCMDSNYACHHLMVGLVAYMKDLINLY